jgi:hypothetical protein
MGKIKYIPAGVILVIMILSTTSVLSSKPMQNNAFPGELGWHTPPNNKVTRGPILEVTTNKLIYNQGETVKINIANVGIAALYIVESDFFIYDQDNNIIYGGNAFIFGPPWGALLPGESVGMLWHQINNQGEQAPLGRYTVEVYMGSLVNDYVDTSSFEINLNPPKYS